MVVLHICHRSSNIFTSRKNVSIESRIIANRRNLTKKKSKNNNVSIEFTWLITKL